MILPYSFRVMAALPGQEPVELLRRKTNYCQADWLFATRDLSPEWTCWTEHTTPDKDTITSRPKVREPHVHAVAEKLRLYDDAQ